MLKTHHSQHEKSTLKVLMTESSLNWGGQEARLRQEALWLIRNGHEVILACPPESRLAKEVASSHPHLRLFPIPSWKGPSAWFRLLAICKKENPDIIHTRSSRDGIWGGFLRLTGRKVVRSRHLTIPKSFSFRRSAVFRFGADRVVASANFIAEDLAKKGSIDPGRIDVVGEGVDLNTFHPDLSGQTIRKEFDIPESALCFGMIAMIRGEKGHRHFVNAAIALSKRHPDVRFLLAGDGKGSYADNLKTKIRTAFPEKNSPFIFMGFRKDIASIMAALDVLVVPSTSEAQTLVIPKAFACGKCVVASRVGGIPEIVTHHQNGLLVEPGNQKELVDAMQRLIDDPALRATLSKNAAAFAIANLQFDQKGRLLLESYYKALKGNA